MHVSPDGVVGGRVRSCPGSGAGGSLAPQVRQDHTLAVVPLRPIGDPRLRTLLATGWGHPVAVAPDSKRLALFDGSGIAEVDASSVRPPREPVAAGSSVTALQYSSDGKALIIGDGEGALRSWDPATGHLGNPHPLTAGDAITSMALTPRGDRLLVATSSGLILSTDPRSLTRTGPHSCRPRHRCGR